MDNKYDTPIGRALTDLNNAFSGGVKPEDLIHKASIVIKEAVRAKEKILKEEKRLDNAAKCARNCGACNCIDETGHF